METQEVTGNGTIGEGEGRDLTFSDLLGRAGSFSLSALYFASIDACFLKRAFAFVLF